MYIGNTLMLCLFQYFLLLCISPSTVVLVLQDTPSILMIMACKTNINVVQASLSNADSRLVLKYIVLRCN